MSEFLEQASIVQALIKNAVSSLNHISDDEIKKKLIISLEPFYSSVTPTAIDVEEIKSLAIKDNLQISHVQALEILENVMYDIDFNCVDDSIKFHFNEFFCKNT